MTSLDTSPKVVAAMLRAGAEMAIVCPGKGSEARNALYFKFRALADALDAQAVTPTETKAAAFKRTMDLIGGTYGRGFNDGFAAGSDRPDASGRVNQCDGCRRGLPLLDGVHRGEGYDLIGCTAHLYALAPLPATPWRERVERAMIQHTGHFNPDGSHASNTERMSHALAAAFPEYAPADGEA